MLLAILEELSSGAASERGSHRQAGPTFAWLDEAWRGRDIALSSIAVMLLAATPFLWADWPFGMLLRLGEVT